MNNPFSDNSSGSIENYSRSNVIVALFVRAAIVIGIIAVGCSGAKMEVQDEAKAQLEETWLVEGTGSADYENGRLQLREEPDGVGVVAWLRDDQPSDMNVSFDLAFSNNRCIGVIFFAATGPDGGDLFDSTPRTGDYEEYIRGEVNGYSLSLHRYWPDGRNNPGSNLRRNSGFHLLSQRMPDPVLEAGRTYKISINKRGPRISVRVDGDVIHDVTDDGVLGKAWERGKIGFRLRGHESCVMTIDSVEIARLDG